MWSGADGEAGDVAAAVIGAEAAGVAAAGAAEVGVAEALSAEAGVAAGRAVTRPIPLVGSLVEKAVEILLGIQQHYTYTSAS